MEWHYEISSEMAHLEFCQIVTCDRPLSQASSNAEEMVVEGQRRKTTDLAQFRFPRRGSSLFSSRKMGLFCLSNTLENVFSF